MFYVLMGFLTSQQFVKLIPIDALTFCWITYVSIFIFANNQFLASLIFHIVLFLIFVILGLVFIFLSPWDTSTGYLQSFFF